MVLADSQQLRLLERLRAAGKQPVTIGELRGGGIDFPAVVISELELHGYAIERVYKHGRLICSVPKPPIHAPHAGATDGADFRASQWAGTRRRGGADGER